MIAAEHLPEIAVVTVTLNAARDLPLTIESVLGQSYPKLRLFVADGESWDETDVVLRRYRRFIDHVTVRADAGIYHAMNAAIEEVTSDYVLFLNAGDHFWSSDAVERMVAELDGRPDIFYGNHIYVDRHREIYKRSADFDWLAARLKSGTIDHAWHSAIPGHQATFARADLLRKLRFDTRLRIGADHELLFRAHAAGGRMQYVDQCVAHYFGGGFSALAGERSMLEGASIYRRFSEQPQKIDRFFFPHGSPFVPQTEKTGFQLGGFTRLHDGPMASGLAAQSCWVSQDGGNLVGPDYRVDGIVIRGWNELDGQEAEIHADGKLLAALAVPSSSFRLKVAFDGPVEAGGIIAVVPRLTVPSSIGERVGFALQSFQFLSHDRVSDLVLRPETEIRFSSEMEVGIEEILGSGWSVPEGTHIWSLGTFCDLSLAVSADARHVRLLISGNPHVPHGEQRVVFKLNGSIIGDVIFHYGEERLIEFPCDHQDWQRGRHNHLSIHPHASAVPPADMNDVRDLGVCIWKLTVD